MEKLFLPGRFKLEYVLQEPKAVRKIEAVENDWLHRLEGVIFAKLESINNEGKIYCSACGKEIDVEIGYVKSPLSDVYIYVWIVRRKQWQKR